MIARRAYIDGPFGQIHIHQWGQIDRSSEIILCLPPSPFTGQAYNTLAPKLIKKSESDICVIAVDYPRFAGKRKPSIQDYANVVNAVIAQICTAKTVTLLGFHTGCLVAVETSLISKTQIERLVLIDVPYFDEDKRKNLQSMSLGSFPLSYELMDLQSAWDLSVTRQKDRIDSQRALEMFTDHISAGPSSGEPFMAAFAYDCTQQFPKVTVPCFVIATQAGLYEENIKTTKEIVHSVLLDEPTIKASVLEKASDDTAKCVMKCLS